MRSILMLTSVLLSFSALAIDQAPPLADPALQARYEKLTNELRCLVCQNQSIADSTADLADDLRVQVREMLMAGSTDDEILDYMVDRYGDFVRYRPDFNERTWMLWIGPFIVMGVGLLIGLAVMLKRTRASETASTQ